MINFIAQKIPITTLISRIFYSNWQKILKFTTKYVFQSIPMTTFPMTISKFVIHHEYYVLVKSFNILKSGITVRRYGNKF